MIQWTCEIHIYSTNTKIVCKTTNIPSLCFLLFTYIKCHVMVSPVKMPVPVCTEEMEVFIVFVIRLFTDLSVNEVFLFFVALYDILEFKNTLH